MAYKFIRYKKIEPWMKEHNIPYIKSQWYFVPQSESDILEFFHRYTMKQVEKHKNKLEKIASSERYKTLSNNTNGEKLNWKSKKLLYNGGHASDEWEWAYDTFMHYIDDEDATQEVAIAMYGFMAGKMLITRFKVFRAGVTAYYDKDAMVCRCFPFTDKDIADVVEIDKMIFPDERKIPENVKYIQWPGGKHWYAKLGGEDIVVEGKQKWNTKQEAEKAVAKYFEQD